MSGIVGTTGIKSGIIGQSEIDIGADGWVYSLESTEDYNGETVLAFNVELHKGSNIQLGSGRATVTKPGWYYIAFTTHNNAGTDDENYWMIKVNGVNQPQGGSKWQRSYVNNATETDYITSGTVCSTVYMYGGQYAEVYGLGNLYGNTNDAMSWFVGYRLGA